MSSIYKACDIRGTFGAELREEHGRALGHALAIYQKPERVLVGGDGRLSTPVLKSALVNALLECGIDVLDVGTLPTPMFYFARQQLGVAIGVMVTASHNPAEDNGFKIILGELPVTEADLLELRCLMESGARGPSTVAGKRAPVSVTRQYLGAMRSLGQGLTSGPFALKVGVDSGNGMWGPFAPGVLRDLGCEVVELFSEVDGRFPNREPNPAIATNLGALCEAVPRHGAALGIAFDGDGDRVAFVDEQGKALDNDRAIVLLARDALARHPGTAVVYDQKCSDVVREEVLCQGGKPVLAKSGHIFIKTEFLRHEAAYAGELSGHHFFSEIHNDDGLFGALRMVALVQASGQTLSQLAAAIPQYAITPDIRLQVAPAEVATILGAVRDHLRGAQEISQIDGVRAQFEDGWGLVRASVTEPAITLRFEGRTPRALQRIKAAFQEAAPQLAGRI